MIAEQDFDITELWEIENLKDYYIFFGPDGLGFENLIPTPSESKCSQNHEGHETLGSFHRKKFGDVLNYEKE